MQTPIMAAISGQEILFANSLATVATDCLVIRTARKNSQAIVSLDRVRAMQTIKISVPAFLVIAAGCFLLAAAAYCSKDGGSAEGPLGGLGAIFVVAFLMSRRAAVVFTVDREQVSTIFGGLREASGLVRAVKKAQTDCLASADEELCLAADVSSTAA